MTVACADVGGINLAQGVCDTDPPHPVVEAAIQAIRDGHNIYVRLDGIAALREAIAQKLASFNGIDADPNANVLVTSGATGALHAALLATLDPGDECIVFEPFYGYHTASLNSLRVKPAIVSLASPDWTLDLDRLRAAITPRTRGMILNTPANPSGKVFSREELEAIAELAIEHDLFVFTDEIYEYFLYDGERHISLATLPGMAERTITLSGFSKTFSVTGWRLGYLTASERWIPAIGYFHDLLYVCAPTPLQYGAAAGLLAASASASTTSFPWNTRRSVTASALRWRVRAWRHRFRREPITCSPMPRVSKGRTAKQKLADCLLTPDLRRLRDRRSSGLMRTDTTAGRTYCASVLRRRMRTWLRLAGASIPTVDSVHPCGETKGAAISSPPPSLCSSTDKTASSPRSLTRHTAASGICVGHSGRRRWTG